MFMIIKGTTGITNLKEEKERNEFTSNKTVYLSNALETRVKKHFPVNCEWVRTSFSPGSQLTPMLITDYYFLRVAKSARS